MSAREIIARNFVGLYSWGDCRADIFAGNAVEALTAAGYRLVGPGEVDAETVERCAQVAERTYAKDPFRFELNTATAAAIRALSPSIPAMPNSQDGHTESRDREGGV